jgi:endonuclease/exonuclease/phosphatase (EEP) superfamily protein YafD
VADDSTAFRASWISWFAARVLILAGTVVLVSTLARVAGNRWWFADLLNQFAVQYVILLIPVVAGLMVLGRWRGALVFLIPLLVNLWVIRDGVFPTAEPERISRGQPAGVRIRILTHNVLRPSRTWKNVEALVREFNPDIVALQEVDKDWMEGLGGLRAIYPHFYHVDHAGNFGIALFSRIAWEDVDVQWFGEAELPSLHFRFQLQGRYPVELVNTHPLPPTSSVDSRARNGQLLLTAANMDRNRSRILLGDFNLTPWSPWFQEILRRGGLRDAATGFGFTPTWHCFPTVLGGVRIDHVLASPDWIVENYQVGGPAGSDHLPVIVDLALSSENRKSAISSRISDK